MNLEHGPDEPAASYEAIELGTSEKKWTLSLFTNSFRLETPDGEPLDIHRAELRERVQTFDSWPFMRRVLTVKLDRKKPVFKLSEEGFSAVCAWIGPPTREDLKLSLKRRLSWVLPIGILFVLAALPLGDLPFEPVSFGLGLALIFTSVLAKLWPHRNLFALDSLWFSFLAANSVWLLIQEWSWMRGALLLLQLALVRSGWHEFSKFAPERMADESLDSHQGGRQEAISP